MKMPSKSEVVDKLRSLVDGNMTREEASNWAREWVASDNPPQMEQDVWEAIKFLYSVDAISLDRPYLYYKKDFERVLDNLKS